LENLTTEALAFARSINSLWLARIGIFAYLVQPFRPKVKGFSEFQFIEGPRQKIIQTKKVIW
jgi:hypothetical protein